MPLKSKEKEEMLTLSRSRSLRADMRVLSENGKAFTVSEQEFSLDDAIRFLTQINDLTDHLPKPFKKMKGRSFIL